MLGALYVGWVGSFTWVGVGADRDHTPTGGVPTRGAPCIHIRCGLDVWFCWAAVGRVLCCCCDYAGVGVFVDRGV